VTALKRDLSDRALLSDLAGWAGTVRTTHAQVLLEAIRSSCHLDQRKALSSVLVRIELEAIIALGQLYLAVRTCKGRALVEAHLTTGLADTRGLLLEIGRRPNPKIWNLMRIPSTDSSSIEHATPPQRAAYIRACTDRSDALARVSEIARANMLLPTVGADSTGALLVTGPNSVSAIKTGRDSASSMEGDSAFLITGEYGGRNHDATDLVAIACPTIPTVLDKICADIDFLDSEISMTSTLVALAMDLGVV